MRRFTIVAIVAMVQIMAFPAAAQIVLDNFGTTQSVSHNTPLTSVTDEIAAPGAIGGIRAIRLTQAGGAGSLSGVVSGNQLQMSTTTQGDLTIWWDGLDDDSFSATGLGGIDLTGGGLYDRFVFEVSANTLPADVIRVQIYRDGSRSCYVWVPMPVGQVEVEFSTLGSCSGGATVAGVTQNAGAIYVSTVFRPGAWSFTFGGVESTPVDILTFSIE